MNGTKVKVPRAAPETEAATGWQNISVLEALEVLATDQSDDRHDAIDCFATGSADESVHCRK